MKITRRELKEAYPGFGLMIDALWNQGPRLYTETVNDAGQIGEYQFTRNLYGDNTRYAVAVGHGHEAYGNFTTILGGYRSITRSFKETLLGSYPVDLAGTADSWVDTERLFAIGNGQSEAGRADALRMYKSGYTVLNNALRLGDFAWGLNNPEEGVLRYTAANRFEGYHNSAWHKFLVEGDNISLLNNDVGYITASSLHDPVTLSSDDTAILSLNSSTQALTFVSSNLAKLDSSNHNFIGTGYHTFSGNVGIGTTTPIQRLQVVNNATEGMPAITIGGPIFQNNGNYYKSAITILGSRTGQSSVLFSDADNQLAGEIEYSHANDEYSFKIANTIIFKIASATTSVYNDLNVGGSYLLYGSPLKISDLANTGTNGQIFQSDGANSGTWNSLSSINISSFNNDLPGQVYPSAGVAISNGTTWGTSLANTTVGTNFLTATNPSAVTFPRVNSDNTVSFLSGSSFRSAIGAGTMSGFWINIIGESYGYFIGNSNNIYFKGLNGVAVSRSNYTISYSLDFNSLTSVTPASNAIFAFYDTSAAAYRKETLSSIGATPYFNAIYIYNNPVSATTPTTGQALVFDGTYWNPGTVTGSGGDYWQALTGAIAPATISDQVRVGSTADLGSTYIFQVTGDSKFAGTLTATSTMTATNFILSDIRLKSNISDLYNLFWVDQIQLKSFNMHADPQRERYGAIAQEVEKINPSLVQKTQDDYLSINYVDLLIAKVARLEQRIKELEGKS